MNIPLKKELLSINSWMIYSGQKEKEKRMSPLQTESPSFKPVHLPLKAGQKVFVALEQKVRLISLIASAILLVLGLTLLPFLPALLTLPLMLFSFATLIHSTLLPFLKEKIYISDLKDQLYQQLHCKKDFSDLYPVVFEENEKGIKLNLNHHEWQDFTSQDKLQAFSGICQRTHQLAYVLILSQKNHQHNLDAFIIDLHYNHKKLFFEFQHKQQNFIDLPQWIN
ncbi:MAG: hypothetical protein BGO14_07740 [Chlamydiales bacterium 38-26]|nr:MAG: hypothetical protein BGO14_07740 [Chlamydiales bacterium 38-26]